jgi:PAS domain S-box-containing protein
MAAPDSSWNVAAVAKQLAEICDRSPEIVFFSRPDGYCEYLNTQFYRYTGLQSNSAEGRAWESVVHPEDREPNWDRWLASVSSGRPYELCNRLLGGNDSHRWFLCRSHPFRDSNGRILLWVGMSVDIEPLVAGRATAEIRGLAELSSNLPYANEVAIRINRLLHFFSIVKSSI